MTSSHTTGHHLAQALMAAWMMCVPQLVDAGTVERKGAGPDATAIQAIVDQFRLDLGAVDNGSATGPFASGRREIDWDDVPEALASPARLPADYFNTTSPRGAVFTTSGTGFQVSNLSQPRFSNYKATYADDFTTFSAARLFTAEGSNVLDVTFRVPGTNQPATVSGFGVVLTDVDSTTSGASIEFFDEYGERLPLPLGTGIVPTSDGGLSFLGISFDAGERIARVRIRSGQAILTTPVVDPFAWESVAMDDFIYGEPQPIVAPAAIDTRFAAGLFHGPADVTNTSAVAVQPDGKVVLAGSATSGDMSVLRLNTDGSLDTTFGTGGHARVDFGQNEAAYALALQRDGRIVVAGRTTPSGGGTFSMVVARLMPDGQLDKTFGGDGRVLAGPGVANTVTLDEHRRIVLAGTVEQDIAIVRLASDGSLDSSFNPVASPSPHSGNGRVRLDLGGFDAARAIALTPGGHIVLAGDTVLSPAGDMAVVQLLPGGIGDPSFGQEGIVTIDFEGIDRAYAVAVQDDGRVVVAGSSNMGSDFAVARLLSDGTPDLSFNAGGAPGIGRAVIDFGSLESAAALDIQADGRIVLAGYSYAGGQKPAVARLTAAGLPDPTFGTNGRMAYALGLMSASAAAVAVDALGQIVVAGPSQTDGANAFRLIGGPSPGISITAPDSTWPTASTSPFARMRGMAGDVVGVTEVTWSTDRGFSGIADGTVAWGAEVPMLGGTNVVTVTARNADGLVATDTVTITIDEFVYYLSEGATGPFFDLDILLANPTATAADVAIAYLKPDGTTVPQTFTLGGYSRRTIAVEQLPGLADTAVSAVVRSTNAVPLVVERTMFWGDTSYGGHTGNAVEAPAVEWFFGEGSQGFFDTYVLLANANSETAHATVTFMVEGGPNVVRDYEVAPTSRLNVYAGTVPELTNRSFSIAVTSNVPIIAERAMYFGQRLFEGGHESAGVSHPSTRWFHAEGATGPYFDTYILIGNANPTDAHVTVTFLKGDGTSLVRHKVVQANSRLTLFVDNEDPSLADTAVSTTVVSDLPVVSERAMYWAGPSDTWFEAHNSFGVTAAARKWALAEGRVGQTPQFDTFVLIANHSSTPAQVRATFLREDGSTVVHDYDVKPTSRFNIWVNDMVPELVDENFGVLIEVLNDVDVAVERALYWTSGGVGFAGGTNATAVRVP